MIRDMLFLRVFGGKAMGKKRLVDITGDDVLGAYKAQAKITIILLFIVVAIMFYFISTQHIKKVGNITQTVSPALNMTLAEYYDSDGVKERVQMLEERSAAIDKAYFVKGQTPEYYDALADELDQITQEYAEIRSEGGF